MATLSNNPQQPQQPPQQKQQTLQVTTEAPWVQVQSLKDQEAEIGRLTNVASQWSTGEPCRADNIYVKNNRHWSARHQSTQNMSLVTQNYKRQYMYNDNHRQQRHGHYDRRFQQYNRQEINQRRYSQNPQNANNNNVYVINALENDSTKQALIQSTLNALQEYDGSNREASIPWLDQVELITENTSIYPLEIMISKLKGLALANISIIHKEEGLSWHKFKQCLIEQYLSVLDAMLAYSKIS